MKYAHFRQIAVFLLNDSSASLWGACSLGELPKGSVGLWGCPAPAPSPAGCSRQRPGGTAPGVGALSTAGEVGARGCSKRQPCFSSCCCSQCHCTDLEERGMLYSPVQVACDLSSWREISSVGNAETSQSRLFSDQAVH